VNDCIIHQRTLARKLLLFAAGISCVAGPIAIGLVNTPSSWAQSKALQEGNPASFEVADIKPNDPSAPVDGKGFGRLVGERFEFRGGTVAALARYAYLVPDSMIVGLPKWANDERFDIVAKAPPDTPIDVVRRMVQTLLAERFKLVTHREERPIPVYALTLGSRAPKFHEASGGREECRWKADDSGLRTRECHNISMAGLAKQLSGLAGLGIDLPVVDQTGLKGVYDVQFEVGYVRPVTAPAGGDADGPAAIEGPTGFEAMARIGLKLERRKIPMPVIVVDHIERPSAN